MPLFPTAANSLRSGAVFAFAAFCATPAFASTERLEAELQALFADGGELQIGELSDAFLRSRYTAEDVVYTSVDGERLHIGSYVVHGDYDEPERVTLEDIRIEDALTDLVLLSIDEVVLNEPSRAVYSHYDAQAGEDYRLGGLTIDQLMVDLSSDAAQALMEETGARGQGRLEVERIYGESLSAEAVGLLELTNLSATGENLEGFGSGSLMLESMRLEELTGLQEKGEEQLGLLLLENMQIDSDQLVGRFDRLRIDGDISDAEAGMQLDAFEIDLERMIAMAPAAERAQMRMASNVLTDGSGQLKLDAGFTGRWEQQEGHSVLGGDSNINIDNAMRLLFDMNVPLILPNNAEPMEAFHDTSLLDAATLLGGDLSLTLSDMGLFSRLVTVGAALEGISEAQLIEQARTQAQGFGMMFGPEVQQVLLGLVTLLEGSAEELEINIDLPAESNLETYTNDPLGVSRQLDVQVETR
ncbi:hypothetical protein R5M92_07870 [Halomonas sp. Bachu 37]|uniref:hypothetical protein n=1 Tax=Halomonas kashgarensis TaxID=3084920 RepID=UPI003217680A